MNIGLRIDVDTYRGTKFGVPALCRLLASYSVSGTFFFSVGPDNMGRHLWRLFRPAFLRKMLRSKAASLYGWDILLRGTLWPGPVIGEKWPGILRDTRDAGHEIGLHAWDHHDWQARIDRMNGEDIRRSLQKGVDALTRILGQTPACSAVPAWKCNDLVLLEKAGFPFRFNSDCRGDSLFYPVVNGQPLSQPQVPVTLPTYDEIIGQNDISDSTYNQRIISELKPGKLQVLTVHAEVEGLAKADLFESFLKTVKEQRWNLVPLGRLLDNDPAIGKGAILRKDIPGREGWLAVQSGARSG